MTNTSQDFAQFLAEQTHLLRLATLATLAKSKLTGDGSGVRPHAPTEWEYATLVKQVAGKMPTPQKINFFEDFLWDGHLARANLRCSPSDRATLQELWQHLNQRLSRELCAAEFTELYAQTFAYGVFTAWLSHPQSSDDRSFDCHRALAQLPTNEPLIRQLFATLVTIEETSLLGQAINQFVQQFSQRKIVDVFGDRTTNPIFYFYETFLAHYDAKLRKRRGVYYTPQPVVSFMVRSLDGLLKNRFDCPLGLADNTHDPVSQQPRLKIFDPATGTGTFLLEIIQQIDRNLAAIVGIQPENFVDDWGGDRLVGFELLLAPYAIAHLQLGLALRNLGSPLENQPPLGIYLTPNLAEAFKQSTALFTSHHTPNESSVQPLMIVVGNPPYGGHSANQCAEIDDFLADYYTLDGRPIGEKNSKYLKDDYVKFMRFGQWQIQQTGAGILAFITNNGYLDNPTFRGMRKNLLETFTEIYLLDLHGNSKKKETSPGGAIDQNVFRIQQGVSIGIFIRQPQTVNIKSHLARVYHADLWGSRSHKYTYLSQTEWDQIAWQPIQPAAPFYLFRPQITSSKTLKEEYAQGWKLTDIMPVYSTGIKSHRDHLVFDFDLAALRQRVADFRNPEISEQELGDRHDLSGVDPEVILQMRQCLQQELAWEHYFSSCLYRPLDLRAYYHHPGWVVRSRHRVMRHLLVPAPESWASGAIPTNLGLVTTRQTKEAWEAKVSAWAIDNKSLAAYDTNSLFPLYLSSEKDKEAQKKANFSSAFLSLVQQKLGYLPPPQTIFAYLYAVLHSPTYRQRYDELLKLDFAAIPITSQRQLFQQLSHKGEALIELHLMRSSSQASPPIQLYGSGNPQVTTVRYHPEEQRVYINKDQYFSSITPETWQTYWGGYQVARKWLKDRQKAGRSLSLADQRHYQNIITILQQTQQIMQEIDALIPEFPLL